MHVENRVKLLFWTAPADLGTVTVLAATRDFTLADLVHENAHGKPTSEILRESGAANFNPILAAVYLKRNKLTAIDKFYPELKFYTGGKDLAKGASQVYFNTNADDSRHFKICSVENKFF